MILDLEKLGEASKGGHKLVRTLIAAQRLRNAMGEESKKGTVTGEVRIIVPFEDILNRTTPYLTFNEPKITTDTTEGPEPDTEFVTTSVELPDDEFKWHPFWISDEALAAKEREYANWTPEEGYAIYIRGLETQDMTDEEKTFIKEYTEWLLSYRTKADTWFKSYTVRVGVRGVFMDLHKGTHSSICKRLIKIEEILGLKKTGREIRFHFFFFLSCLSLNSTIVPAQPSVLNDL